MPDVPALLAGLSVTDWVIVVVAALLVGFSKTAIGGLAMVAVAMFAFVLPTKDSTGAVLLLLLTGDLVAIWVYRKHVDWRLIARLILPVLVGIGLGAAFLAMVDDLVLKRTIGIILLVLLVAGFWKEKLRPHHPAVGAAYGGLAGFTTMVANAGGPPMNLYLLAAGYDKWRFLGTSAWFFFAVNLTKLPVSIGLGIIRPELAALAAVLVPAVLLGTWVGRMVIKRIDQKLFEGLVTVFVAVTAVYLLFA
ncbi:MAG: sulfite exporter TauE/SafE family protein [Propionicimonas sp.]|uniref:sulfite exporter TauE/SafE family protein n=1 Tax=Propionicimonas sp. TaxID=1955623 RepID=UPI002B21A9EF|nr:sulfite exporter TauE/SafE family protein [Propionicimonas sp.]MEA4943791.1 sulfite exporter TauE/SafE family protein [Propionicimonas sp.]MEA5055792.1 sulfite exporter TauE/SafE family protein [Propionicimonas sp.]MEA5118987.1 sulfite exporter TauE/SafE family protein [Propionicimonas sp.]